MYQFICKELLLNWDKLPITKILLVKHIFGYFWYIAFLGGSVFTLFSIAAFHYKTVVLEMELASKRRVLVVITMIWLLAITGSLFSNGLFTGTYGFTVQSSGLYCINDFTEMHLLERVFNSGIVFILVIAPVCFILIYYRIWKKLGLNRRQLFLKRHQATGETERVNINKMIIRRAIAVSSAFAFVFYYDAGLFAYQIVTGNRVPWIYDAIGASIGATITVVNPILFFSLDVRSRKVILEIFFTGAKEKARELSSIRVDWWLKDLSNTIFIWKKHVMIWLSLYITFQEISVEAVPFSYWLKIVQRMSDQELGEALWNPIQNHRLWFVEILSKLNLHLFSNISEW